MSEKCEICGRVLTAEGMCPGSRKGFGACPVCHEETNSFGDCIGGCCRMQYDPIPIPSEKE